ncbi:MAG: GAF domain-containing protein [Candidatus Latescibacteria bacterium]|nr:GAF domain-containing protein [Candidatus Latescibacterota bacterium]NIO56840.1 GAF domain-containing protein [Candidatus Latescibacterota bacterium]
MQGTVYTGRSKRRNAQSEILERQLSRNWYLLAGATIASTCGTAIAFSPLLGDRFANIWPWANTHIVLLAGLAAAVVLLIVHLTVQQWRVTAMRGNFEQLEATTEEREQQNRARLHALLNISRMMGAVNDPENVFSSITSTCREIFESDQASLMLLNETKDELHTRSSMGHLNTDAVGGAKQKVGEGIAGWVAQTQQPLILDPDTDMSRYPGLELKSATVTAAMVVPILLRGELVGILNISSRKPEVRYTDEDLQALQVFAENAGTVIRHSEQAEWMRRMIEKQRGEKSGAPLG